MTAYVQEMRTDAREEACRSFTSRNWSYFCRSHHFDRRLQCTHFGPFVNISKHANRALLLVVNIITIRTLVGLSGNFVMHILATNTSKNKIKYVDENLFFLWGRIALDAFFYQIGLLKILLGLLLAWRKEIFIEEVSGTGLWGFTSAKLDCCQLVDIPWFSICPIQPRRRQSCFVTVTTLHAGSMHLGY